MTENRREKKAARERAAERGINYTQALRELRAEQAEQQEENHE